MPSAPVAAAGADINPQGEASTLRSRVAEAVESVVATAMDQEPASAALPQRSTSAEATPISALASPIPNTTTPSPLTESTASASEAPTPTPSVIPARPSLSPADDKVSLRPSQAAISIPAPNGSARGRLIGSLSVAAGVLLVAVGLVRWRASAAEPRAAAPVTQAAKPAPLPAPEATPPVTSTPASANDSAPAPTSANANDAAGTASASPAAPSSAAPAATGPVTVTILATPKGAIILEHAHRVGVNKVQVTVEPGKKRSFVALMDNYAPKRFSVDGSSDTVEVKLSRSSTQTTTAPAAKAP